MMAKQKRMYNNTNPSVTEILSVLRKIALERWYQWNDGKWCQEQSRIGRIAGTQIHDAIEQHILTGTASVASEYANEVMNALNSFILFKEENPDIQLKMSEVALTSNQYGFNGTIDAPNPPILIDWKSSNAKDDDKPKIYDEHKYQVAAYVYLWNEMNEQKIDSAKIVCFAKDKVAYSVYNMEYPEIQSCFINVFLPCLSIYNHQKTGGGNNGKV